MNSLLVVLTILLSVAPSSIGQLPAEDTLEVTYRGIPENQRQPLKRALDKLLEAEKAGDWKSIYVSIDKHSGETEDKFTTRMKGLHPLREFRPSKVTSMPPGSSWNIQGCASFEGDRAGRGQIASVHARWEKSQWLLSPVAIDLFGSEKTMNPRECTMP